MNRRARKVLSAFPATRPTSLWPRPHVPREPIFALHSRGRPSVLLRDYRPKAADALGSRGPAEPGGYLSRGSRASPLMGAPSVPVGGRHQVPAIVYQDHAVASLGLLAHPGGARHHGGACGAMA